MKTKKLNSTSSTDMVAAANMLNKGGVVAVPTETVYGLAANAADEDALSKIFEAKGRPANHPLIVHIADASHLTHWARDIPPQAYQLAEAFWPGPLTLLLNKQPHISSIITGGLDTIGLRNPAHPVMLELLHLTQLAVAAPSANPYKKLSPTTADQVFETLAGKIDAVLDGGPCEVGIESTILDLSSEQPTVLRPGPITASQIANVLGTPVAVPENHDVAVPGNVEAHYQPSKPMLLLSTEQLKDQLANRSDGTVCVYYSAELKDLMTDEDEVMSADKVAYAQSLYHTLYQMDQSAAQCIWLELPPSTDEWRDVHDRLNRAGSRLI
ncbi:L-threonylcarbamoyladenylate synthase [Marinicella sp. S1101]|uniref:L-threonylcarbamoyladenylate synthase n=1 Tax=Marinicella marina TaxID=2996016 RepID=UPI002260A05F|nr:L-threonylcarbamoyladenylate synthase [Marinicella marina]MCX7553062.1 L-threonylcarbamoyladenylate synthase [Marinicella marina]MDJ1139578.1 L-threonylcarbamoyladenylate synthase [Marinicella marina]